MKYANPYLPEWEYVPDGEPHVFGDRVYVYGSHDRFDGAEFCMNDYIAWSAPVDDLSAWRYEGVIFRKDQDPRNPDGEHCLWAPDVAKGADGKYYLYYCLDYLPLTGVAVSDSPAGKYEFIGFVSHPDGTPLGEKPGDSVQFDPGVFVDDDGQAYYYSGNAPRDFAWHTDELHYSVVAKLESDMVTLASPVKRLIPTIYTSAGSGYEGHEFFEASSIRKYEGKYYFVYSSILSHELCWAVSDRPDSGYRYGGTLVSIGDIGLDGREAKDSLNMLGNTHGGVEKINGQWYVFYHRQTNRTNYSRQACAERMEMVNGEFRQVEITSQGFSADLIPGRGVIPARIACNLMGPDGAVFSSIEAWRENVPYFTQDGPDADPDGCGRRQYIANFTAGSLAAVKYVDFSGDAEASVVIRGRGKGIVRLTAGEKSCDIPVLVDGDKWTRFTDSLAADGVHPLEIRYFGSGAIDILDIELA